MNKEVLKYNMEDFRKIENMEDFYVLTGLMPRIKNRELTQFDIHMNREECEMLNDFSKENNRKNKKRKWSQRTIDNSVAMDWLNYSPTTDNPNIPKGELWIYKDRK